SGGDGVALVAADLSTGETRHAALPTVAALTEMLTRLAPREVLLDAAAAEPIAGALRGAVPGAMVTTLPAARFDAAAGSAWLQDHGADDPRPAGAITPLR